MQYGINTRSSAGNDMYFSNLALNLAQAAS